MILPVFICQAKVITPGYFSSEPFTAHIFQVPLISPHAKGYTDQQMLNKNVEMRM